MPQIVIGWDHSHAFIDAHSLPDGVASRIENTSSGITAWAASLPPNVLVVFGATSGSGCNANLITALAAAHITFVRVNPRQAREFARAIGVLAKADDRIDARVLAEMGRHLPLEVTIPPDPAQLRLADFLRRRK